MVHAAELVNRTDADRPHEVFNVLSIGPARTRALSAGQPDVLLRDGRYRVEGRPARRLRVRFNQRCGAEIRRLSMCHPLRDNPVYQPAAAQKSGTASASGQTPSHLWYDTAD